MALSITERLAVGRSLGLTSNEWAAFEHTLKLNELADSLGSPLCGRIQRKVTQIQDMILASPTRRGIIRP